MREQGFKPKYPVIIIPGGTCAFSNVMLVAG